MLRFRILAMLFRGQDRLPRGILQKFAAVRGDQLGNDLGGTDPAAVGPLPAARCLAQKFVLFRRETNARDRKFWHKWKRPRAARSPERSHDYYIEGMLIVKVKTFRRAGRGTCQCG